MKVYLLMQSYKVDDDGDENISVIGAFSNLDKLGDYTNTHEPAEWCMFYVLITEIDNPAWWDHNTSNPA